MSERYTAGYSVFEHVYIYIYIRAVSVNALIYAINAAAINAIKYFNAVNATFFFLNFSLV